ncbi:SIMPL domain-containing protein [uncultured Tateyamaria sp.]|uniref:SIMPL domain-containing protein n=1 Tax=uncultured Tateyamaria sp. TaxID=455651 RepID=UPI0026399816|nr:SIMPL domain-containing protein [uncultured Tateyamaria sp.]
MRMLMLSAAMLLGFVMQGKADAPPRILSVVGEAQVATVPDMAVISLGVTHTDRRAGAAMDKVNADANALLEVLATLDVAPRDVQTDQLSVSPIWDNGNNGPRRITGFVARNAVSVRVRDLGRLSEIMDAALDAGSNDFNGLRFALQNPNPVEAEARAAAVKDAMSRAAGLAEAAGVALGPIITLSEQGGFRQPQMMMAARSEDMAIATGEVGVSASVAITFDLIP